MWNPHPKILVHTSLLMESRDFLAFKAPSAHSAAAAIFEIHNRPPSVNMVGNLQQQGVIHPFDFISGFQDDTDFGKFFDFGVDFTFGDAFDFKSISSWAFEYGNVSCEFSVKRRLRRCQKKRRTNRVFRFENVKKSCWYRYFTRPGPTREITHELSSSNGFGEFCHWFCMPLSKVEDLTNILIDRGHILPPRSHRRRAAFCERVELLVMSALYLVGSGA
jgi:hypothetical protein